MQFRAFLILLLSVLLDFPIQSQDVDSVLLRKIGNGVINWRSDLTERKAKYVQDLNILLADMDTAEMNERAKTASINLITKDIEKGVQLNALHMYDELPAQSNLKNKYIRRYLYLNQDFQIDRELTSSLITSGVLDADGTIKRKKLEELSHDISFLDVQKDDRILMFNAFGAEYAMMIGYIFDGISLTIHNRFQQDHYLALDRADRYPRMNDGNLIEFIQKNDSRLMVKNEKWNKIVLRETYFLDYAPGPILNSFHDNLSDDGHLFLLHSYDSGKTNCFQAMKEKKIMAIMRRAKFELIDKRALGCVAYYKFKSVAAKK